MFPFANLLNNISKKCTTLQVHPFIIQNSISEVFPLNLRREASFFASFTKYIMRKNMGASLTLEATIVLPVFIFVICAFYWFFIVFMVQMELQGAMRIVARDLSEYTFLYEEVRNFGKDEEEYIKLKDSGLERWLVGGITEVYVEGEIQKQIGKDSAVWSYITGGSNGIELKSFLRIPDKDGMIDLILVYSMRNPFLPKFLGDTDYVQRCRIRAWTGFAYREIGEDEDEVEVVYVTEYGKVYHLIRDCTYLDISLNSINYVATNVVYEGILYTECSICAGNNIVADKTIIYITDTGEKYHWSASCRSLKRIVYELPKEEAVKEYPPCSRCGKEEKE